MVGEVVVLLDRLEEDKWWSQGGILQPDEVYKDDLRRYRHTRVLDDVRGGQYVAEVEDRISIWTDGIIVSGFTDECSKDCRKCQPREG
jgi:hypothetical protein